MRVALDLRPGLGYHGIGRYCRELFSRLAVDPAIRLSVIANVEQRLEIESLVHGPSVETNFVKSRPYRLMEQIEIPFATSDLGLLHVPSFNVPRFNRRKLVVTLHDVTHLRFPEAYGKSRGHYWRHVVAPAVRSGRAAAITVSHAARSDLIDLLGLPEESVHVVYNGVTLPSQRGVARRDQQVFILSSRQPHKRIDHAMEAVRLLRLRGWLGEVIVAGDLPASISPADLATANIQYRGSVPDSALHELYSSSHAFLFPSHAEGFGLPLIEALAAGCATVCYELPVFRELVEDLPCYASELHPEALADALQGVLTRPPAQDADSAAKLADRFSWDRATAETIDIYRAVVA